MAEWCCDQVRKAGEAMDKIAERMAKNSEFISDADEMIENYNATGQFDRDKARRRLAERGVKMKDDVSDAKLAVEQSANIKKGSVSRLMGDFAVSVNPEEGTEDNTSNLEDSLAPIENKMKNILPK